MAVTKSFFGVFNGSDTDPVAMFKFGDHAAHFGRRLFGPEGNNTGYNVQQLDATYTYGTASSAPAPTTTDPAPSDFDEIG